MRYFIKPEDGEGGRHFYISDICGISGTITHILRNAQKDGKYGPKDIANVADLTTEYDEPSAYIEGGEITITLQDITFEQLQEFYKWVHRQVSINAGNVHCLMDLAEKYRVAKLKSTIKDTLESSAFDPFDAYILARSMEFTDVVARLEPTVITQFDKFLRTHSEKLLQKCPNSGNLLGRLATAWRDQTSSGSSSTDPASPPTPTASRTPGKRQEVSVPPGPEFAMPSRFDSFPGVSLSHRSELVVRNSEQTWRFLTANLPVPRSSKIYYFEISVESLCPSRLLGSGSPPVRETSSVYFGLTSVESANRCTAFERSSRLWIDVRCPNSFRGGIIAGCCINYVKKVVFFTVNGLRHGAEITEKEANFIGMDLYPAIQFADPPPKTPSDDIEVTLNFGKSPFMANFKAYLRQELNYN